MKRFKMPGCALFVLLIAGNLYAVYSFGTNEGSVSEALAAGEKLFISFTAPSAGTYSVYGMSKVGTYCEILDIYGTEMGTDDNSYDGKNFYKTLTLEKDQRVFVRAKLDSTTAAGDIAVFVYHGTAPKPIPISTTQRQIIVPGKGGYLRFKFTPPMASTYYFNADGLNGWINVVDQLGNSIWNTMTVITLKHIWTEANRCL